MLPVLITGTFEVSSILHVALLVYLRLRAVRQPLNNKEGIIARRNYLLSAIWFLIITNNLLRFTFFSLDLRDEVDIMDKFNFWVLVVTPVVLILSFYIFLLLSVWKQKNNAESTMSTQVKSSKEDENRRTTRIVMRLVITLLICYIPYIVCLNGIHDKISSKVSNLGSQSILSI